MMRRRTIKGFIIFVVCLFTFEGCDNAANKAVQTESKSTEITSEETEEIKDDKPEEFEISLAFAGDINFDESLPTMQLYRANGSDLSSVIDDEFQQRIKSADLFWINNEFAYSNRGTPLAGKMWTFCALPENVSILQELETDIAGLANNHVYDYGADAMEDTLYTLHSAGIDYVGAGYNLNEAKAPVYLEADGVTIAYVAASRAEKYQMTPQATDTTPGILRCYDNTLFDEAIREAKANADYVIALPHWGTEHSTVLEDAQLTGAREYIDCGADAVIGAHTHCLQGIDFYNDKPVVYSLGNFWFDEYSLDTMLVVLHIKGEKNPTTIKEVKLEIVPGTQQDCMTRIATDDTERRRIFDELERYEPAVVSIDDDGFCSK